MKDAQTLSRIRITGASQKPALPKPLANAFYSHPRSEGCAALSFPSLRGVTAKREWRHFRARKNARKSITSPTDRHARACAALLQTAAEFPF
ncbi:hypothetical protein [Cupriavidus taiwanensis]|uniref:hypothetical protein n=1 Tax=Cupriavidus taiwanensis TaxID=164546 RepID=UPI0011C07AF8